MSLTRVDMDNTSCATAFSNFADGITSDEVPWYPLGVGELSGVWGVWSSGELLFGPFPRLTCTSQPNPHKPHSPFSKFRSHVVPHPNSIVEPFLRDIAGQYRMTIYLLGFFF